jgi:hypothetical protein
VDAFWQAQRGTHDLLCLVHLEGLFFGHSDICLHLDEKLKAADFAQEAA